MTSLMSLRKKWIFLPECGIIFLVLFFAYRELGTFPRSWLDEGIFLMVARTVAAGHGYAIPLLDHLWHYPYFLAVGPTVILPAALSMKLFGATVAAARIPMTFYILGNVALTYAFARRIADRSAACWAAALLITLSAFVNTGKPVLGEVPAFFFLLLGLLAFEQTRPVLLRGLGSGLCFGLSIITKLTFGLLLPALALGFVVVAVQRRRNDVLALMISGITAVIVCIPWRVLEMLHTPSGPGSLSKEISSFVFGGGDLPVMYVVRYNIDILTQLPFLAFSVICILGLIGMWKGGARLSRSTAVMITTCVILFLLYYLNSYGWYRHLLPAHLLLIPFVPSGLSRILKKEWIAPVLTAMVLTQGAWQLAHQGSGRSTALDAAVQIINEKYATTDLLIEAPEVFAQLPENPHWLFLPQAGVALTMPEEFMTPTAKQRCFAHLTKLNSEQTDALKSRSTAVGAYTVVRAPAGCR